MVYIAFLLILAVFAILLYDNGFLSVSNLLTIGRQAAPVAVMAVGMTFALAAAEIDLSVGSVVGLSTLVVANLVPEIGAIPAAVVAILIGTGIGLFNGVVTVWVRIPSFLVTLGTLGIVGGISRNLSNLQSVPIRNEQYLSIFGSGSWGPLSSLLLWTTIIGLLGHLVLRQLRWGRHVLATGASNLAARSVGLNTNRIRIGVLMLCSGTAALAGVLLAGRLAIGRHSLGENDLLTVIAAVVVGGTSLFGGRASVIGAITGAGIMAMLNNGLILMGLSVADQQIGRGIIIILAVALSLRQPVEE